MVACQQAEIRLPAQFCAAHGRVRGSQIFIAGRLVVQRIVKAVHQIISRIAPVIIPLLGLGTGA